MWVPPSPPVFDTSLCSHVDSQYGDQITISIFFNRLEAKLASGHPTVEAPWEPFPKIWDYARFPAPEMGSSSRFARLRERPEGGLWRPFRMSTES